MSAPALTVRDARRDDVPAIVAMLADDDLGAARELLADPLPAAYYAAFAAIEADPRLRLMVAEREGRLVGTFQLVFIPGLSQRGARRATIEAVRVVSDLRGAGLGAAMMAEAIAIARAEGCTVMELSTHASRKAAHRFYERLGFVASHIGMKRKL